MAQVQSLFLASKIRNWASSIYVPHVTLLPNVLIRTQIDDLGWQQALSSHQNVLPMREACPATTAPGSPRRALDPAQHQREAGVARGSFHIRQRPRNSPVAQEGTSAENCFCLSACLSSSMERCPRPAPRVSPPSRAPPRSGLQPCAGRVAAPLRPQHCLFLRVLGERHDSLGAVHHGFQGSSLGESPPPLSGAWVSPGNDLRSFWRKEFCILKARLPCLLSA